MASRVARALRAACAALALRGAVSWGPEGHERINRVAQSLLKGKRQDQIRAMMHSDVIDVADWEVKMTRAYRDTDVLHWHHQKPEFTCENLLGDGKGHVRCETDGFRGAEEGSMFCGLAYFWDRFSHDALLEEYPKPKEPIGTPAKLDALAKVNKSELKVPQELRWLITLLGDMHQPLHWLQEHNFGRDLVVNYLNQEFNLLTFWEDFIPKHLASLPPSETIAESYSRDAKGWSAKIPPELFRDWAKEMASRVCSDVYGRMYENHAGGKRSIPQPFRLSEELFAEWVRLAQALTVSGGQRVAFVLQSVLEHRRHRLAHKEGRGHLHLLLNRDLNRKKRVRDSLLHNGGIAAVTLPTLLFLFWFHRRWVSGGFFPKSGKDHA